MSDYPMLISNKLHSFRNFRVQNYGIYRNCFIKSVKLGGFFYFRMLGMGKDIIQIKDK